MPTFKIDGKDVPFEPGDSILRAAHRQGVEIPHYCWHPGLSVAANCRMCLVEVTSGRPMMMPILKWDAAKNDYVPATKPKLQPACQTPAGEGLEVATASSEVVNAQKSVQELLLLNHPVDCPICDQAGECKLQDYWLAHQHAPKRKLTEPVHKPKAVRFGPTIVYDAERCIMCTRCIRFTAEVAKDPVLDMRQRGNRNEVVLAPGRELDHDYTLMTEHVCPVGALTSRDFRFKARVWFLKSQPIVCTGCATGCNAHADFDPRTQQIHRLRPRENPDVNGYWMCDEGMLSYQRQSEARVFAARVGRGEGARHVGAEAGLEAAAALLSDVERGALAVVLSAGHSSEDNHALARLAKGLGAKLFLAGRPARRGDSILRHADANPNRRGAELAAGGSLTSMAELLQEIARGEVRAVLGFASAIEEDEAALASLANLPVVALASHRTSFVDVAEVVLPVASVFEAPATFVNAKGIAQVSKRVVSPPPGVSPAWRLVGELGGHLGLALEWGGIAELRSELRAADSTYASLGEARV